MNKSVFTAGGVPAVNFREIRMGEIAPNTLYRSNHPVKDLKQEKAVSRLAANAKIAAILNLSDTVSSLKGKAIFAPWYNSLFKNKRVIALGMDFSFTGENFSKKLKKGLRFITATEGPWLIHCNAGVDRTGFVCMVLESFMGAALGNIINDYLESFNGNFESSIYGGVQKPDLHTVMRILSYMNNSQAIDEQNLRHIAEIYLRKTIKLPAKEMELLRMKLSGNLNHENDL